MTTSKTPSKTSASKTTTRKTTTKTPRKTTTAAKTASTRTTTAKTAPKTRTPAKPAAPAVVSETVPTAVGPELKKQELIEKVVQRTGAKRRDVKPIVDAMLAVVGDALREGRELNVEPLGKLKVNRVKHASNKRVSIVKLRQNTETQKDTPDPLASAAE